MKTIRTLAGLLGAAAIAITATVTRAGDHDLKQDLAHYFPIAATLAEDSTEGIKDHADALAKSESKPVAKAAASVSAAADLAAARKAFGELSKALIAETDKATRAKQDVGTVYVFECPMAKPYGRWMQGTGELRNPYHGKSMLTCGKQIAAFGAADGGHGGGHGAGGAHGGGHGGGNQGGGSGHNH